MCVLKHISNFLLQVLKILVEQSKYIYFLLRSHEESWRHKYLYFNSSDPCQGHWWKMKETLYFKDFRPCAQMGLACVSRWNLIKSSHITSENLTFAEHLRHWEQKSCSRYIVVLWSLGLNQSGQFKATFYTSSFVQFNLSEPIEKQKEVTPWPKSTLARFQ